MSQLSHNLLCPSCKIDLVMSERQNIEIDYCPQCRGIWLDRGELDKIIEKSQKQQGFSSPEENRHSSRDTRASGHHGHGYRKKSWLSEILD